MPCSGRCRRRGWCRKLPGLRGLAPGCGRDRFGQRQRPQLVTPVAQRLDQAGFARKVQRPDGIERAGPGQYVEAVRLEVDRALLPNVDGEFNYELRLWIRQCNNDLNCDNILGTFFEDTRIAYDYTAVTELPMRQNFSLEGIDHDAFERFFFGFTGAAGAEALDVTIRAFQLSFIRPGDPVVDCDRNSWPLEDSPPLPDCVPLL